jgi:2-oxoglutarate ferredoxin oxidoreductase subunit alpha
MSDQFAYPAEPLKRGKVLTAEQVADRGFARYLDVDGDGIPYRTIPGNENPEASYFNRGTGHTAHAVYSEKPQDWVDNMARLKRKFNTARQMVPEPVIVSQEVAEIGLIFYGSTTPAVVEARASLAEAGIALSLLRLRALPINDAVRDFVAAHRQCYVIELNRDGQMHQILSLEMPALATRLESLAHMDGMPLTAAWLVEKLLMATGKQPEASD